MSQKECSENVWNGFTAVSDYVKGENMPVPEHFVETENSCVEMIALGTCPSHYAPFLVSFLVQEHPLGSYMSFLVGIYRVVSGTI